MLDIKAHAVHLQSNHQVLDNDIDLSPLNVPKSLVEVLQRAACGDNGVSCVFKAGSLEPQSQRLSYQALYARAQDDAKALSGILGLSEDRIVLMHFDNHAENIRWFWAVTLLGHAPCISAPFTKDNTQRLDQIKHLRKVLEEPVILTNAKMSMEFEDADDVQIHQVDDLRVAPAFTPRKRRDDIAALMLTSGSTGNSKVVCLDHSQMVQACLSKSQHSGSRASDVFLNWVGLDHAVNLTEQHLQAMLLGAEQVHVQADDLFAEPLLFLDLIHSYRVTRTFAPNFFLDLILGRILEVDPQLKNPKAFDLSSLVAFFSGGEANVVQTCKDLEHALRAYGAPTGVVKSGYGLTESCAGITWSYGGIAEDALAERELASSGLPLPGNHVRIMAGEDEAPRGETGDIQLSGVSVFKRYLNDPVSTAEAFTADGWFKTGDRGFIDTKGCLNMSGRVKELININGIKYLPQEIEMALEQAHIPGMVPSFTAAFSHRPKGARTESYCVVYSPSYAENDGAARSLAHDSITRIASVVAGIRPYKIIPMAADAFNKSALGKISRAKLRSAFEAGKYDELIRANDEAISTHRKSSREQPANEMEQDVLEAVCQQLDAQAEEVDVTTNIFYLGFSSLDFFTFTARLQSRLQAAKALGLTDILGDPTVRGIAKAATTMLSTVDPDTLYDPVVPLKTGGSKAPLWLVHPASGNVLAFVLLARSFLDRPVYGLRSTGVKPGERLFGSFDEIATQYTAAIRRTQPHGPYAIAGYSLGSSLAFEISKRLEADGESVPFVGALDSPPHIAPLVGTLTWSACLVMVSFFYELIPERYANTVITQLWHAPPEEALDFILREASASRLADLQLDRESLRHIANVTNNFGKIAGHYEPEGTVSKLDLFVVDPLLSVASSRQEWIDKHLVNWAGFVDSKIQWHQCEGSHADMLGHRYIQSFQRILKNALKERGV